MDSCLTPVGVVETLEVVWQALGAAAARSERFACPNAGPPLPPLPGPCPASVHPKTGYRVLDTLDSPVPMQGLPYRPSLKGLTQRFLGRTIQAGAHNSHVDADVSLQLAQLKFRWGRCLPRILSI